MSDQQVTTCKSVAASVVLFTLAAVPLSVGFVFAFASPADKGPTWQFAIDLASLPIDGTPLPLTVFERKNDAWQRTTGQPFRIFVSRSPNDGHVRAYLAEHHPQFHIPVTYDRKSKMFRSACWNLTFNLSGRCRELRDGANDLPPVTVRVVDGQIQVE